MIDFVAWSPNSARLKVLQPLLVEAGDEPGRFLVEALRSPDSQRVAFSISRARRKQYVAVFRRAGDFFSEIPLPEIPEARIADKYARGGELGHCVSSDYQTAKRWPSNLRLTVESDMSYDGDGSMVTALRTTVLGFGPGADDARVLKSSMKTVHHKE